jgi:CheY-like chemotaxis protein
MGNTPSKIIVIDDNPDYLFTMKTFLTRNGFNVETASDGDSGIELIRKHHPDLVMLDVMMESTYSGFEVCRVIRNDPELKTTPIIGISGMAEELGVKFDMYEDKEYFTPDAYFDKPVDKEALLAKINDFIS